MWAGAVVGGAILLQHPQSVPLAQDDDLVEARLSDRADPSLRDGIRIRRWVWRTDDAYPFRLEDHVEGSRELGIPVTDQESG